MPYLHHYSTAFAFSAFLYPLRHQPPLRLACPIFRAAHRAYHVLHVQLWQARPALFAGSVARPRQGSIQPCSRSIARLAQAWYCAFGLFRLTTFIKRSHVLAILSDPDPIPVALSGRWLFRNPHPRFSAVGLLSGELSQETVTSLPCPRRILPVERQVLSVLTSRQLNMRLRVAIMRNYRIILFLIATCDSCLPYPKV